MELCDHPVSGCLFILLPNNHWPLRVVLIHYSPIQYFINYFSINWNGVSLIPFNYFINMEFFSLFLSKFFSSYSLGMEGIIFYGSWLSTFVFCRLGVWSSHHCWFPPHLGFLGGLSLVVDSVVELKFSHLIFWSVVRWLGILGKGWNWLIIWIWNIYYFICILWVSLWKWNHIGFHSYCHIICKCYFWEWL